MPAQHSTVRCTATASPPPPEPKKSLFSPAPSSNIYVALLLRRDNSGGLRGLPLLHEYDATDDNQHTKEAADDAADNRAGAVLRARLDILKHIRDLDADRGCWWAQRLDACNTLSCERRRHFIRGHSRDVAFGRRGLILVRIPC